MNIRSVLKSSNNRIYKLLLILLAGVCMLIIVWPSGGSGPLGTEGSGAGSGSAGVSGDRGTEGSGAGSDSVGAGSATGENYMNEVSTYTESLEKRLATVIESMDGISDVQVMITVKDNGQRVALKDRSTSQSDSGEASQSSVTEDTVLEDVEGQSTPYVTRYMQPEVEGVVICCRGAENAETTLKITNAVQALFDVQAHKIVILEAN